MSPEDPTAGELLRLARQRARLSQSELAGRAGVAQSVISAYERGRREPALSTLRRLVAASGCELVVDVSGPPELARSLPDSPAGALLGRARAELREICRRHGAGALYLFGSVARREDGPGSDVDLAVRLPATVGLVELGTMEREMAEVLGRAVDLVPLDDLRPAVRKAFEAEAIEL